MSKQSYRKVERVDINGVLHKSCNKCNVMQPVNDFHAMKANPDGRHNTCKPCRNGTEAARSQVRRKDPAVRDAERVSQREYARKRREANPKGVNAYQREWRAANPGKSAAYTAKWEGLNPERQTQRNAKRRSVKRNATIGDTPDYASIYAAHDDCYLCGKTLTNPVHMDHVVPLSRGGAHVTSNLLPTHARCNLRKHDALLSELSWYRGPVDIGAAAMKGT